MHDIICFLLGVVVPICLIIYAIHLEWVYQNRIRILFAIHMYNLMQCFAKTNRSEISYDEIRSDHKAARNILSWSIRDEVPEVVYEKIQPYITSYKLAKGYYKYITQVKREAKLRGLFHKQTSK